MRKVHLLFLPVLLLSACSNKDNVTDTDLIISECVVDSNIDDRAIEFYNKSDQTIDLNKYSLVIYQGSGDGHTEIDFNGELESHKTFVIAYSNASEEIKNKADLISEYLIFDGTWPMTLNKGNKVVDVLGTKGYKIDYCSGLDIIRKESRLVGRKEYLEYDYIKYSGDTFYNLGSILNPVSEQDYLSGPHLTSEDFLTPFVDENQIGQGGAVKVNFNYGIDGDTTSFIFVDDLSSYDIKRKESIRYYGIDTPELQHGTHINAGKYGEEAKDFTNSLLNDGKSFALSTAKGQALREGYGRIMCYVWIAFVSNPQPSDYYLMNHLIVKQGYSFFGGVKNDANVYLDIPYSSYIRNAELLAMSEHKNIHSEN